MTRQNLRHPIRDFMTVGPHSIGLDQPLATAYERMRVLGVRHLPVLDGGKLLGVLTQRDVLFVEALRDVDPLKVTVEEAMSPDVYAVGPDASLRDVASQMAEHKYGCAVIVAEGLLVGIFTTVDALRALVTVLNDVGPDQGG